MVIQVTGCEACDALIVQRVRRSGTGFDDIALVKLELHFTGHILLGGLYECLYSFT